MYNKGVKLCLGKKSNIQCFFYLVIIAFLAALRLGQKTSLKSVFLKSKLLKFCFHFKVLLNILNEIIASQLTLTWSKSTIETLEKVKNMFKINNKITTTTSHPCRRDTFSKVAGFCLQLY